MGRGKRNLKGPRLLEVAIGRVTIFDAFDILFSISIGENKSNAEEATSSLPSESPPIPRPESISLSLICFSYFAA